LLVRPYEYIIGRLNGKFSVILHYIDVREASRRTTIMCLLIPFTGSITPTSTAEGCLGAIPANMVHDRRYGNMTRQQPAKSNDVKGMYYYQSHPTAPQPFYEPVVINALE